MITNVPPYANKVNIGFSVFDQIFHSDSSLAFGNVLSAGCVREMFAESDALFGYGETTAMFTVETDDLNLTSDKWHLLKLSWNIDRGVCDVLIDGKKTMSLKIKTTTDTGISYIRFRSLAEKGDTDNAGMLVDYVKSYSEDPFSTPTYN